MAEESENTSLRAIAFATCLRYYSTSHCPPRVRLGIWPFYAAKRTPGHSSGASPYPFLRSAVILTYVAGCKECVSMNQAFTDTVSAWED